jgi:hypothetical protein
MVGNDGIRRWLTVLKAYGQYILLCPTSTFIPLYVVLLFPK